MRKSQRDVIFGVRKDKKLFNVKIIPYYSMHESLLFRVHCGKLIEEELPQFVYIHAGVA